MSKTSDFMADLERRLSKVEATQTEPYYVTGTSLTALRTFTGGIGPATDAERLLATLIADLKRKGVIR